MPTASKPAYHQPSMSSEVPDALKLIADLRAAGASIRKIVEHLNESGVKATRGGIWHVRTVQLALAQITEPPNESLRRLNVALKQSKSRQFALARYSNEIPKSKASAK